MRVDNDAMTSPRFLEALRKLLFFALAVSCGSVLMVSSVGAEPCASLPTHGYSCAPRWYNNPVSSCGPDFQCDRHISKLYFSLNCKDDALDCCDAVNQACRFFHRVKDERGRETSCQFVPWCDKCCEDALKKCEAMVDSSCSGALADAFCAACPGKEGCVQPPYTPTPVPTIVGNPGDD